jgi:hypothetical protein
VYQGHPLTLHWAGRILTHQNYKNSNQRYPGKKKRKRRKEREKWRKKRCAKISVYCGMGRISFSDRDTA